LTGGKRGEREMAVQTRNKQNEQNNLACAILTLIFPFFLSRPSHTKPTDDTSLQGKCGKKKAHRPQEKRPMCAHKI
jgi:hypothetical protein